MGNMSESSLIGQKPNAEEKGEELMCEMKIEQQAVVAATLPTYCKYEVPICFKEGKIVLLTNIHVFVFSTKLRKLEKKCELLYYDFGSDFEIDYDDCGDDPVWEDAVAIGSWVYVGNCEAPLIQRISIDDGTVYTFMDGDDHDTDNFKVMQQIDGELVVSIFFKSKDGGVKKVDKTGRKLSDFHKIPEGCRQSWDAKFLLDVANGRNRMIHWHNGFEITSYSLDDYGKIIWKKTLKNTPLSCVVHPNGSIYVRSESNIFRLSSDGTNLACIYTSDIARRYATCMVLDFENGDLYFMETNRLFCLPLPNVDRMDSNPDRKGWPGLFTNRENFGTFLIEGNILADTNPEDVVTFLVEGKRLVAVKSILMQRSEYFRSKFSGDWTDSKEDRIVIGDAGYEAFKAVLLFLHLQERKIEREFADEILRLADFYSLDKLKQIYEDYFVTKLTLKNLMETHELSQRTSASTIEQACLSFLDDLSIEDLIEFGRKCLQDS